MTEPPSRRTGLRELLLAALVGAVGIALAGLLTSPAAAPTPGHGEAFVAQAQDPWSLAGMFPQRILWPVLAHLAGELGIGPLAFSQVCSAALLAVVFWFCRARGARFGDALLVTAAVGATGAVQLYQVMTCHADTLNWILLLLCVHHVQRPLVFWPLVLLAALSHEMVFFLSPWLVLLRRRAGGSWRRELAALAAVGGTYWAWLQVVKACGSVGGFGAGHYLANHWLVWGTLGLWTLWAMLLLVEFGPLLAIVVRDFHHDRVLSWTYCACVLSTMAFAYDVQRFACHAFLPLVLGSLRFFGAGGSRAVYAALVASGIGTYVVFHWIPGQAGGWPYERAWHYVLGFDTHAPGTRHRFFTQVVPHLWFETACFALGWVAVFVLGRWLRRRYPESTSRNASP